MNDSIQFPPLSDLMTRLGVTFDDPDLLILALTHRSWINEHPDASADNERLEFLGDAVIDFIVGAWLYDRFPKLPEGELTALRSALVRAETLALFAQELTIDAHLRLGFGEDESGGRTKIPTLCAAFEAVIGAIYLDQGLAAATPLVERLAEPMLVTIMAQSLHRDAKSEFQVWAQAEIGQTPHYVVVDVQGPDHARVFTTEVRVDELTFGRGSGTSKQRAAQEAARIALLEIEAAEN